MAVALATVTMMRKQPNSYKPAEKQRDRHSDDVTVRQLQCYALLSVAAAIIATLATGCMVGDPEPDEVFVEEDVPDARDGVTTIAYSTGNLLRNPGFESGRTYWSFAGRAEVLAQPHWGSYSMRVVDDSPTRGAYLFQQITGWPGVRYEVSAYTRYKGGAASSTQMQQLLVKYYDRDGLPLGTSARVGTKATSWSRVVLQFTPPARTYLITVIAGDFATGSSLAGTYEWDDFRLYEM